MNIFWVGEVSMKKLLEGEGWEELVQSKKWVVFWRHIYAF